VIVGSAIIKALQKHAGTKNCVPKVCRYVRTLTRALP